MSKGKLILVATPIDDESPLNAKTKDLLLDAASAFEKSVILQEEPKRGRRRWLHWGTAERDGRAFRIL